MWVMIRYRIRPDRLEEHLESLRAVQEEMAALRPEGLREAVFRLADEVGFVHLVEVEHGPEVLGRMETFRRFRATLDERCDEPPVMTELHPSGAYRFPGLPTFF